MKINKSNYEKWIIDWLDGNLSDHQVEEVTHFLNENPDIRKEFEDMTTLGIKPYLNSFPNKDQLIKTTKDLTESQFEYLCVAYLENDLSSDQLKEFQDIIDLDSKKRGDFELIQKTRLSPASIKYKHKSKLLKRTVANRVLQLSAIGLSAAAAIALIIMTYFSIPRSGSDIIKNSAQTIIIDSINRKPSYEIESKNIPENIKPIIPVQRNANILAGYQQKDIHSIQSYSSKEITNDTLIKPNPSEKFSVKKIFVNTYIDLKGKDLSNTLVAYNSTITIPAFDDNRSKLSILLAKTFREKILKENISKDTPLKAYEIAEAGVTGLNKLLGWEMALDERNDINGELESLYFSSRILKFNAPVKKSEPLP